MVSNLKCSVCPMPVSSKSHRASHHPQNVAWAPSPKSCAVPGAPPPSLSLSRCLAHLLGTFASVSLSSDECTPASSDTGILFSVVTPRRAVRDFVIYFEPHPTFQGMGEEKKRRGKERQKAEILVIYGKEQIHEKIPNYQCRTKNLTGEVRFPSKKERNHNSKQTTPPHLQ